MPRRRRAAIAAVCLALAFPAGALADSAGDNQYQDPLPNSPSQNKKTTTQTTTPAPPPAPTPSAVPNGSAAAAGTTTTKNTGTLPRTGLPLAPLAGLGAAFIAAGLVIRRQA